jgi:oligoribonuclease (3'-5' exoribonuclease)
MDEARRMHDSTDMQADEFEDSERPLKRVDQAAIRILKDHVARHDGELHNGGLVIDREFVVVEPDFGRP